MRFTSIECLLSIIPSYRRTEEGDEIQRRSSAGCQESPYLANPADAFAAGK